MPPVDEAAFREKEPRQQAWMRSEGSRGRRYDDVLGSAVVLPSGFAAAQPAGAGHLRWVDAARCQRQRSRATGPPLNARSIAAAMLPGFHVLLKHCFGN